MMGLSRSERSSSHILYKTGILKEFWKNHEKASASESFNKAIGWTQAGFGETFMNTLFCSTSLEAACLICYANECCIWSEHYSLPAHCVKSVRIRSFSDPYFPAFRLNTDQKTSEYESVSRSGNNLFKTFNTFNLLNVFSYRKKTESAAWL